MTAGEALTGCLRWLSSHGYRAPELMTPCELEARSVIGDAREALEGAVMDGVGRGAEPCPVDHSTCSRCNRVTADDPQVHVMCDRCYGVATLSGMKPETVRAAADVLLVVLEAEKKVAGVVADPVREFVERVAAGSCWARRGGYPADCAEAFLPKGERHPREWCLRCHAVAVKRGMGWG